MSKQTAVEWLKDTLESFGNKHEFQMSWSTLDELLGQAKEMEKEQIEDAHIEGQRVFDDYPHTQWTNDQAEAYYKNTYNKQ
jgi:hypothetical protein